MLVHLLDRVAARQASVAETPWQNLDDDHGETLEGSLIAIVLAQAEQQERQAASNVLPPSPHRSMRQTWERTDATAGVKRWHAIATLPSQYTNDNRIACARGSVNTNAVQAKAASESLYCTEDMSGVEPATARSAPKIEVSTAETASQARSGATTGPTSVPLDPAPPAAKSITKCTRAAAESEGDEMTCSPPAKAQLNASAATASAEEKTSATPASATDLECAADYGATTAKDASMTIQSAADRIYRSTPGRRAVARRAAPKSATKQRSRSRSTKTSEATSSKGRSVSAQLAEVARSSAHAAAVAQSTPSAPPVAVSPVKQPTPLAAEALSTTRIAESPSTPPQPEWAKPQKRAVKSGGGSGRHESGPRLRPCKRERSSDADFSDSEATSPRARSYAKPKSEFTPSDDEQIIAFAKRHKSSGFFRGWCAKSRNCEIVISDEI